MAFGTGIEAGHAYILIEAIDKTTIVTSRVSRNMQRFSMNLTRMGLQIAALGGTLLVPFTSAIREGRNFSDEILFLKGILETTEKDFNDTKNVIMELGRTTSFTATEVAQAASVLARASFSPEQIRKTLRAVLDMARAGKLDLAQAAKIMIQSMSVFNIEADRAAEVADKFFEAARRGVADVSEISVAFGYAAQSAETLGFSLDEVLSILAVMSKRNLIGSRAGTSLDNLLTRLVENADKAKELLGIEIFSDDAKTQLKAPLVLIKDISDALSKLTAGQRQIVVGDIFNMRGKRAALALAFEEIQEIFGKVIESKGQASRVAALMDSEIGGSIRRLNSAIQDLKISISEALVPSFKELEEVVIPLLKDMTDFIDNNKKAVETVLALSVAVLALGGGLIALGALSSLTGFLLKLASAGSGIGLVLGAITGFVVLSVIALKKFFAWIMKIEAAQSSWEHLTMKLGMAWENVKRAFDIFKKAFEIAIEPLKQKIKSIEKSLQSILAAGFSRAAEAVGEFVLDSSEWLLAFIKYSDEIWNQAAINVSKFIIDAEDNFTTLFKNITVIADNAWNNLKLGLLGFAQFWRDTLFSLSNFTVGIFTEIGKEIFSRLERIHKALSEPSNSIKETIEKGLDIFHPTRKGGPLNVDDISKRFSEILINGMNRLTGDLGGAAVRSTITAFKGFKGLTDGIEGLKGFSGVLDGMGKIFLDITKEKNRLESEREFTGGGRLGKPPYDKRIGPDDKFGFLPPAGGFGDAEKKVASAITARIPDALTRGSVEAAKQAELNRQQQRQIDVLLEIKKVADETKEIDKDTLKAIREFIKSTTPPSAFGDIPPRNVVGVIGI